MAIRMVLESIVPPSGQFSNHVLEAIKEEVVYWNACHMKIWISRLEVTSFPIPVHLYYQNQVTREWHNYGDSLVERGIAQYGMIDITRFDYLLHARGINCELKRFYGRA